MTISALPTPPSRSDPANFAARGDAFVAALPTFVIEVNAQIAAGMGNASTLLGGTWAAPGAIGATPNTGAFTTGSFTKATAGVGLTVTNDGSTPRALYIYTDSATAYLSDTANISASYVGLSASSASLGAAGNPVATATSAGLAVTGAVSATTTITATGAFGCNTKTAQTAYASGGALNAYGAGANGFDSGANASALHALVVNMRAALVANGILS